MPPLVSLIVTSYNHAEYLDQRLASLLAQTYKNIEIIVVDDCSTDDSRAVLEKYRHCGNVTLVFLERNQGYANACNRGVSLSKGDYVMFAECDDFSGPTQVEVLLGCMLDNGSAGVVYSKSRIVNEKGEFLFYDYDVRDKTFRKLCSENTLINRATMKKLLITSSCVIPNMSAALFKKKVFCLAGGISSEYKACADWDFWCRMAGHCDFYYVVTPLNNFRWHSTTVRSTFGTKLQTGEIIEILHKYADSAGLTTTERLRFKIGVGYVWAGFFFSGPLVWIKSFPYIYRRVSAYQNLALFFLVVAFAKKICDYLMRSLRRRMSGPGQDGNSALAQRRYFGKHEAGLLMRRLLAPGFFVHAVLHWIRLVLIQCAKKTGDIFGVALYQTIFYPSYLKGALRTRKTGYCPGFLSEFDGGMRAAAVYSASTGPVSVKLASVEITCAGMPDWLQSFDDIENVFALHRWGWLLRLSVECPSDELMCFGTAVMKDWFAEMDNNRRHPGWESYSVSERIVNALMFFYVLGGRGAKDPRDLLMLEKNLIDSAFFLARRLEFHGERTNNHVLNNARALYMLGRFSSCEKLAETGRSIFLNEVPKMITPSGFLREGSSNYHLLLLRSFLEVLWAAERSGDNAFAAWVRDAATGMIRAGRFFYVTDGKDGGCDVPRIGDVTPDFPPEWFSLVCVSPHAVRLDQEPGVTKYSHTGWNKIWQDEDIPERQAVPKKAGPTGFEAFSDSGWYRLDYADLTLIWHVDPNGCVPAYSHGHNDVMSFVLYRKGRPVIIDPGRYSYAVSQKGFYGKSAAAHNTFVIDGIEPYPVTRYAYPPKYRKGKTDVRWDEGEGYFSFKISPDGFGRLSSELVAQREFMVTQSGLKIYDSVAGNGKRTVKTFFHFAKDLLYSGPPDKSGSIFRMKDEEAALHFTVSGSSPDVSMVSGGPGPKTCGWSFPEYGSAEPITTCIIEQQARLPYTATYVLEWDG